MTGSAVIELSDPGFLKGIKGIDVTVDGVVVHTIQFGEKHTIDLSSGKHDIGMVLRGIVSRKTKVLTVDVPEGDTVHVNGVYSRLWGTIKLSEKTP
jgi:hypothetical protein